MSSLSKSTQSFKEYELTEEECKKWFENRLENPRTNRKLKTDSSYLKIFEKQCEKYKKKTESKEEIKEEIKKSSKYKKSSSKTSPEITKEEPKSLNIQSKNTILDFIKELNKYKTAKEAIEKIFKDDNTKSRQGFIYELLWDICIKFNITDFTNKHTEHVIYNFNILSNFEKIQKHFNEYLKQRYISGNSGGYSDITFRTKQEEKDTKYDLNLVSVKYRKSDDITDYDIQKLCTLIEKEENNSYKSINILLFVKDKEHFKKLCESANKSSNILIKYISPHGNYENVYDLQDLEKHYSKLWKILDDFNFLKEKDVNYFKENYLQIYKKKFIPRFHQELFIEKITSLIKKEQKKILVGAIPRSGKTYIMAGTILKDVEDTKDKTKFNNYLIITPAPNETLKQYYEAFDNYYDFKNNNIVPINVKDVEIGKEAEKIEYEEKPESNKHNVFLISKQRLGFRDKQDNDNENIEIYNKDYIEKIQKNIKKYFGDNKFKFIFFDEAHFGMSTRIAQDIFSELDKKNESYKIYVTATYNKPKQIYNVDDKNIIKWDLQDIKLIKNIKNEKTFYKAYENLEIKFGRKILLNVLKKNGFNIINNKNYILDNIKNKEINNIIQQYNHFPEPILLTSVWDKDFVDNEIKKIDTNETFGFDMHKLFMPNKTNNEFINKEQLIQLLEYYFGYYTDDDGKDDNSKRKKDNKEKFYETKNEYEKRGILPNIEKICLNNCRTLQPEHKTTQLWFLPPYEISKITNSLIKLLKKKFNYIFNNYMFYVAVEGVKGQKPEPNVKYLQKPADIKKEIEDLEKKLYTDSSYSKYEGLIILAGSRLQLGISLKNVDIVVLFTHITASDAIYQMIFRSMTEIEDDIECDGKSYCGRKKYGFMVDLNPQRTLFTIDYLTDMYLDNDRFKGQNREKKMKLIADLINIDKHKFIDRYNREDKKGYKNYAKEFFDKLYKAWDAKTENIQRLLLDKHLFDKDIFKPDYNIKELFTEIEKEKKQQKQKIDKPDNEVQKGKTIYDIIKPEKGKKNPNSDELWAYLFAEIISILSLITSYTDKDGNACIFNLENKDNFLYELKQIIVNVIDKDDDIKNILLYTLKKRIIIKDSIEDFQLYNMINNAIVNMEEKQRGGNLLELNKQIQLRKSKIYSIKEPDELLKYINDNLKPKQVEKKERGEVFTPMKLVNEMLDTLPEKVWKNPNLKWLDPAAGIGNFPVAVYMKLMEGLKSIIKDEEKRREHILENMLYMVELDKTNVFMMKKIFCGKLSKSSKKGYELNIFEGSFIDGKYEKKIDIFSINDDKKKIINENNINFVNKIKKFNSNFDIIVGNPPYQQHYDNTNERVGGSSLWSKFLNKSMNLLIKNGFILFITPCSWMSGGTNKQSGNILGGIMQVNTLYYLNIQECSKYFNVGSTFSYYLIKKSFEDKSFKCICKYNGKIYDSQIENKDFRKMQIIPLLFNDDMVSIIKKVENYKCEKMNFKRYYDLDKRKSYLYDDNGKYCVKHKVVEVYKTNFKQECMGKHKVIISMPGYIKAEYDKNCGCSDATLFMYCENKDEALQIINLLNNKLYKLIINVYREITGLNNHKNINKFPFIKNQEDIYRLFKLTKDEIKLIEDNIKDSKKIKGGFKSKKYKLNKSKKLHKRNKSI